MTFRLALRILNFFIGKLTGVSAWLALFVILSFSVAVVFFAVTCRRADKSRESDRNAPEIPTNKNRYFTFQEIKSTPSDCCIAKGLTNTF